MDGAQVRELNGQRGHYRYLKPRFYPGADAGPRGGAGQPVL